MSLPALLVAAFLAGSLFSGIGVWKVQAWRHDSQILAQQAKADEREAQWQQDANTADQVHDEQIQKIHADHVLELKRVRQRAERRPEATAPACQGSSGKELAVGDAEFLAGYAADAAVQQAALRQCEAWVEAVTRKEK